MERFSLSEIQTQYILDTPLRRLTRFDRIELESRARPAQRRDRRADRASWSRTPSCASWSPPNWPRWRRSSAPTGARCCWSRRAPRPPRCRWRSPTTRAGCCSPRRACWPVRRTASPSPRTATARRTKHDVIVSAVPATARGEVGAVTSAGPAAAALRRRPAAAPGHGRRRRTSPAARRSRSSSRLETDETADLPDHPRRVVPGPGASARSRASSSAWCPTTPPTRRSWRSSRSRTATGSSARSSCAPARRTWSSSRTTPSCCAIRPRRCARRAARRAAWRASSSPTARRSSPSPRSTRRWTPSVFTVAGSRGTLDDSVQTTAKLTPFDQYPRKGRATGGVRCQRFLKGEDCLLLAWAGAVPGAGGADERRPGGAAGDGPAPGRLGRVAGEAGGGGGGAGVAPTVSRPAPDPGPTPARIRVLGRRGLLSGSCT